MLREMKILLFFWTTWST